VRQVLPGVISNVGKGGLKMAISYGWTGKILRVDLTTGKITETPTSDYAPKLIGGRGIAEMIYWELVTPECTAFSPENALIMMTGVATGTLAPTNGKTCIVSKSPAPMKETFSWSTPGGHWGPELKFAGYDGIVVTGKSPRPVYLWINDGKAEIRSAERLWGLLLSDMMLQISNLHGPETRVAGIGPAGENLVRQAPIIVDREHATGITGAGAVMGSKNLKCIAVRGTGAVNVAKPKELIDLWYYYRRLMDRTPAETAAGEGWPEQHKSLEYPMWHGSSFHAANPPFPTRTTDPAVYFKNNGLDDPICLIREAVDKGTIKIKYGGCYACPANCALVYQSTDIDIPSGSGQCNDDCSGVIIEWKQYKKTIGFPSHWIQRLCDDYGLGITNALGYKLWWWEELVKLGVLTKENTGLPVDKPWTLEFLKGAFQKLAYRQGELFDRIAEGEERFLKGLSKENPDVKNLIYDRVFHQPGGYYIHWNVGWGPGPDQSAIMQATNTRKDANKVDGGFGKAGVHLAGLTAAQQTAILKKGNLKYFGAEDAIQISGEPTTWNNKVSGAIGCQNLSVLMDCITYCGWGNAPALYSKYTPPDYFGDWAIGAKVYSAVTGIQTTHEQMVEAMNPILNLERCIQVREGRRREHDTFNDATFKRTAWKWTSKAEFEGKVLDEYYNNPARGWDLKTGIPRRSTLEKQGLKKIADEMESKYKITVPA
jgi:aldehyde:ferredoxin oxidoreductase